MNASGDFGDFSDFTISSVNDGDISDTGSVDNVIRKNKTAEIQLLKIELSKKSLELQKCQKNQTQREEELQDRIDLLTHQRDAMQHQLEHEIRKHQEESLKRQDQIRLQLDQATKHQHYLENTNEKLVQSTLALKNVLSENLRIDEYKYLELTSRSEFELSVREQLQIKIYEIIQPLLKEIIHLKHNNTELTIAKNSLTTENDNLKSILDEEEINKRQLQHEFNNNLLELSSLKDKVNVRNYKTENFDKIQQNLTALEEKFNSSTTELERLKLNLASVENERDQIMKSNMDISQSYRLMTLDKEYLSKQVNELNCRCNNAEDRLQTAWKQLEESKSSREQLYDKYVVARDEFRTQYENRLKDELDSLRLKTEHEMEKIKMSTKELFDRENKSLMDQKDSAVADRDIAVRNLRELEERLDRTKMEFSIYQSSAENKISELLNDIKMKSFEFERTNILYDESCNKLKITSLECEKYQAKFEVLTKEYYQVESITSKRINELEMKLEEASKKVKSYEKLEQELDLAVMHAAEDENGRPVLLWPHGYDAGNPIPAQAGRRMQHSIELARRILHLERMLKEKNTKLDKQTKELETVKQDLELSEKILNETKQPYSYLIDALKIRDSEIAKMKHIQKDLTDQLSKIRHEKSKICEEKNRLASDLEQLLSQKDDFLKLKKIVEELRGENLANQHITIKKIPRKEPINSYAIPSQLPKTKNQEYSISRS